MCGNIPITSTIATRARNTSKPSSTISSTGITSSNCTKRLQSKHRVFDCELLAGGMLSVVPFAKSPEPTLIRLPASSPRFGRGERDSRLLPRSLHWGRAQLVPSPACEGAADG
ncbi:hypothetical protein EMEDMD4_90030 [Sinorhizobium medicae]|uniref:Uncharacterized protein n=1 Tax=Sinorhizobium medicae TaxID=110321 RepID=A0A508X701_9HYPH|nr:hypothetical protein EMEDMD4_90030 [Sinorhizobium medicae]